jgi:hypothetical protein
MATSSCPTCGYVFAPFETNCPRCALAAAQPTADPITSSTDTTHSRLGIAAFTELGLLFSDLGRFLIALLLVPVLFYAWFSVLEALHMRGGSLLGPLAWWGGLAAIIALGARIAPRSWWYLYFPLVLLGPPLAVLLLIAR